jgi:hypothetical protein
LSTIILIEALDECKDKEQTSLILSLLGQHIKAIPHVKVFITSRPESHIRSEFRHSPLNSHTEIFSLHTVDRSSVDSDIALYLRTQLSGIGNSRNYWDDSDSWPKDDDIAALVQKCSGLFILAATVTKLIRNSYRGPKQELKVITSEADLTIREGESGIDQMYRQVLLGSFERKRDAEFFNLLRLVVGSIVLVFNPLSCADLSKILGITKEGIGDAIHLLHSVLMVPDSDTDTQPLRIYHKSFSDFITDPERCTILTDTVHCTDERFCIEPSILHMELATRCLRLMNTSLKKNMCDLSSYAINKDIGDLHTRREKDIGSWLVYACRSWAKHLHLASAGNQYVGCIVKLLQSFFEHHLLEWLEVLSVVGDVRCALYSLQAARGWFDNVSLTTLWLT